MEADLKRDFVKIRNAKTTEKLQEKENEMKRKAIER